MGKIPLRRERLPTPVVLGFPCGSAGKESTYNPGNLGSVPGWGRSPGEGKDCIDCIVYIYTVLCLYIYYIYSLYIYIYIYIFPIYCIDCIVHGVAKSWTKPTDFHFHFFRERYMHLNPRKSANATIRAFSPQAPKSIFLIPLSERKYVRACPVAQSCQTL